LIRWEGYLYAGFWFAIRKRREYRSEFGSHSKKPNALLLMGVPSWKIHNPLNAAKTPGQTLEALPQEKVRPEFPARTLTPERLQLTLKRPEKTIRLKSRFSLQIA